MNVRREVARERSPIGGICAIIVGIINLFLVLYIVAIPADQRFGSGSFYEFYIAHPATYTVVWTVVGLTGLLCFSAILPAVNRRLEDFRNEWFRIVSLLAIAGWAVMALKFFTLLGSAPGLAEAYLSGDELTRNTLDAIGLYQLDPYELLAMTCPGLWLITVNVIAFHGKVWNRVIAVFGMVIGLGYIAVTPATIFELEMLDMVAAGLGAITAPVWFIYIGRLLFKA
jgi:hypothetical protein